MSLGNTTPSSPRPPTRLLPLLLASLLLLAGSVAFLAASPAAAAPPAGLPAGGAAGKGGGTADPAPQKAARPPGRPYRDGEILVKFRASVPPGLRDELHGEHGARKIREFPRLRLHRVKLPPGRSVEEAVRGYREDPRVEYAEPDYVYLPSRVPDDPRFGELWGLRNTGQSFGFVDADADAPGAWELSTGSPDVVVAVIDTGVAYTHEDLAANLWTNPGEIPGNGVDDDGNGYVDDVHGIDAVTGSGDPMDTYGHGTHVAGTIAAVGNNGLGVTGVAWSAKVVALAMFDDNGYGYSSAAVECLEYVLSLKERGVRVVATNNSWGGGDFSEALRDAIAAQGDTLFVAAAGNGGDDSTGDDNDREPHYPSSYPLPNVVAVAATDRYDGLASFSNHGARSVHLGAPGVSITSTMAAANRWDNTVAYRRLSGTSMATPHVTGLAALLAARTPSLSGYAIRNLVLSGGDPLAVLEETTASGRRLDLRGSLACADAPLLAVLSAPAPPVPAVASTVSVLSVNCAAPAGPVTASSSTGEAVALLDDGVAPDAVAGDGVFSGSWTPGSAGAVLTVSSPSGERRVDPSFRITTSSMPRCYNASGYGGYGVRLAAAGAVPPLSWSLASGTLPPGLSVDNVFKGVTGVIESTDGHVAGTFPFTVRLRDGLGRTASKPLSIEVVRRARIATMLLPEGVPGAPYMAAVEADDPGRPWSWSVTGGSLPEGLALDPATGTISGVAARTGEFDFTLAASDGDQPPTGRKYRVSVVERLPAAWALSFDRSMSDRGYGVAEGADGSVYVTGSSDVSPQLDDLLLLRYDPAGRLAWSRTWNGPASAFDGGSSVAVDREGNVLVGGYATVGSYPNGASAGNALVQKYDPDGNLRWSRSWPGDPSWSGRARGVATDGAGNVYVGGYGARAYSQSKYVVLKYDPSGTLLWSREHLDAGTAGMDEAAAIGVDGAGNVYLSGGPTSSSAPFPDIVTLKFDPDGTLLWSRRFDGGGRERGNGGGIAVSAGGEAYVTGYDDRGFLVVKYDPDGTEAWARSLSGAGPVAAAYAHGAALDGAGNVVVTGAAYLDTGDTYKDQLWVTASYDPAGNLLWTKGSNNAFADGYFADGTPPGWDQGFGVALARNGDVLVTGAVEKDPMTRGDLVVLRYAASPGAASAPPLSVLPLAGFAASGVVGGPFSPTSRGYTLWNGGTSPLAWIASKTAPWLSLSAGSGTLAPGGSATVTVSVDGAAAASLPVGSHADEVVFSNGSGGAGGARLAVALEVTPPAALSVSPSGGGAFSGGEGGPFTPSSRSYVLANTGGAPLSWSASADAPWLDLSPSSGILAPGASVPVSVSPSAEAASLATGTWRATATFTNGTNGAGSASRGVTLSVTPAARLSVTPPSGFTAVGAPGGPFTPSSRGYVLSNDGGSPLSWSAAASAPWLTLSSARGELSPGEETTVTVTVSAAGYPEGSYADTVAFWNGTNGVGSLYVPVSLSVRGAPLLSVSPAWGLYGAGPPGGPFVPASQEYTLSNLGGAPLSWSASADVPWALLSPGSGVLSPGGSAVVAVSVAGPLAAALPEGSHSGSISFVNGTNGEGSDARGVAVSVEDGYDTDGDGVPDVRERGPEGTDLAYDGNVDGVSDWMQDNTASLRSFDGSRYVTVEARAALRGVGATAPPATLPAGLRAPYGFFSFLAEAPGGGATVRFLLDREFANRWYMDGPRPLVAEAALYPFPWDPLDGTGATFDGFAATLRVADGGTGDGDLSADGVVTVVGGPVVDPSAPPNRGGGGGCAASGDGSPGTAAGALLPLAAWLALRRALRRRRAAP